MWCAKGRLSVYSLRFQAPVRDEESESQRKARSRLMRQSRRSTQVRVRLPCYCPLPFWCNAEGRHVERCDRNSAAVNVLSPFIVFQVCINHFPFRRCQSAQSCIFTELSHQALDYRSKALTSCPMQLGFVDQCLYHHHGCLCCCGFVRPVWQGVTLTDLKEAEKSAGKAPDAPPPRSILPVSPIVTLTPAERGDFPPPPLYTHQNHILL